MLDLYIDCGLYSVWFCFRFIVLYFGQLCFALTLAVLLLATTVSIRFYYLFLFCCTDWQILSGSSWPWKTVQGQNTSRWR